MRRPGRCFRQLLPLALALFAGPASVAHAAKTPANGELVFIGIPNVSPPVDEPYVLRAKYPSGVVDTLARLPTGNAPRRIAVSPLDGLIYVLGGNSILQVDPCTGAVATISSGGFFPSISSDGLCAHSNGSLYWTKAQGPVVRVDRFSGAQTALTNLVSSYGVGGTGLKEGPDHQLYVSTATSSAGTRPWVVRVDPNSGASAVVGSFNIQSTNVRDLAFDTRDSLYVLRVGFNYIVYRVDQVAGTVSPYVTLTVIGTTFGSLAGHPDGGLYFPCIPSGSQWAILRLDPVSTAVTTIVPQQPLMGFLGVAVMRGFSGCPTETRRSTWGRLKARYR